MPVLASRDRKGLVTLKCVTEGARIRYAIAGEDGSAKDYSGPFELKREATVAIRAEADGLPAYAGVAGFGAEISDSLQAPPSVAAMPHPHERQRGLSRRGGGRGYRGRIPTFPHASEGRCRERDGGQT